MDLLNIPSDIILMILEFHPMFYKYNKIYKRPLITISPGMPAFQQRRQFKLKLMHFKNDPRTFLTKKQCYKIINDKIDGYYKRKPVIEISNGNMIIYPGNLVKTPS